jgi:hypothetical protein
VGIENDACEMNVAGYRGDVVTAHNLPRSSA